MTQAFKSEMSRWDGGTIGMALAGQAITTGKNSVPNFDREKFVHCGACLWNCATASPESPERMSVAFGAGTGGLHSAGN